MKIKIGDKVRLLASDYAAVSVGDRGEVVAIEQVRDLGEPYFTRIDVAWPGGSILRMIPEDGDRLQVC